MTGGNRQRILEASIDLFNTSGTIAVTTNHIARHLRISPGNLYFHFSCREDIVRELFGRLCVDTYKAWDPERLLDPRAFLEQSFEVFWTYRFFHREMYHLRRQDPELAKQWKQHMRKCNRLLKLNYLQWVNRGLMRRIANEFEIKALTEAVLMSSSAYLGFYESPDKPATRRSLGAGIDHVAQLLAPYIIMQ